MGILFFFLILVVILNLFRPRIKGWMGESLLNFQIKQQLDHRIYHLIPDVMLPTSDGTTQIDHIIVSRYGIIVVETKNYKGWIFGGEHDAQWTQQNFRRKDRFQNPLRQNYKHLKTLSELTGIPENYFKSLIVFMGDCTFKTPMPPNVIYPRSLASFIKRHTRYIIRDEQVNEIVSTIQEWAATVTRPQRAGHIAHVRGNQNSGKVHSTRPRCPLCRSTMVLRKGRIKGRPFWGCGTYPACRGWRPAE